MSRAHDSLWPQRRIAERERRQIERQRKKEIERVPAAAPGGGGTLSWSALTMLNSSVASTSAPPEIALDDDWGYLRGSLRIPAPWDATPAADRFSFDIPDDCNAGAFWQAGYGIAVAIGLVGAGTLPSFTGQLFLRLSPLGTSTGRILWRDDHTGAGLSGDPECWLDDAVFSLRR